jgi:hypothetical protein
VKASVQTVPCLLVSAVVAYSMVSPVAPTVYIVMFAPVIWKYRLEPVWSKTTGLAIIAERSCKLMEVSFAPAVATSAIAVVPSE